ncbi:MAG: ECF-type sigma factor [Gemmatimonadetes bacterium]|nr:ECF-type sigma factor [Gemmatimonadota bacterium]
MDDQAQSDDATRLVEAWAGTGADVWDRLFPLVYDELRRVAHRQLGRELGLRTLQTTGLVHEAFLRLVDETRVTRKGRAYFFAAASRAMRQVLIDLARRRRARKRDAAAGVEIAAPPDDDVDTFSVELLDLDRALEELAALEPRHARVVECRFFAGMSVEETAEALEVSARTVAYDWVLARAWLHRRLGAAPA